MRCGDKVISWDGNVTGEIYCGQPDQHAFHSRHDIICDRIFIHKTTGLVFEEYMTGIALVDKVNFHKVEE